MYRIPKKDLPLNAIQIEFVLYIRGTRSDLPAWSLGPSFRAVEHAIASTVKRSSPHHLLLWYRIIEPRHPLHEFVHLFRIVAIEIVPLADILFQVKEHRFCLALYEQRLLYRW